MSKFWDEFMKMNPLLFLISFLSAFFGVLLLAVALCDTSPVHWGGAVGAALFQCFGMSAVCLVASWKMRH